MKKKAYIILTTVLLLISPILYRPFKISAAFSLPAPFLGVNYYVYDEDYLIKYTMSGEASENTSNRNTWMCVTWDSRGCKTYQNVTTDGATYTNQSTITFNNTTLTPSTNGYKFLYKLEFILDNDYVGEFTVRVYQDSSTYKTVHLYVNGSSVETHLTGLTGISSVEIRSVNLNLKPDNIQWTFPVESFLSISTLFNNGFKQVGFNQYNNYLYPIFEEDNSKIIVNNYSITTKKIYIILYSTRSIYSIAQLNNYFTYNSSFICESLTQLHRGQSGYIVKLVFSQSVGGDIPLQFKSINNGGKFTVIYATTSDEFLFNVGTDFALEYQLNNKLLDNLNIIANGTPQSDQSVSDSDTTNQQAAQTFAQEEQLVNNAEENLQDNLDALDIQNQNNNLFGNSKFVASAQWVKLQFDNLTQNNAFGYMITFSLVIGLALVIVGKLRG